MPGSPFENRGIVRLRQPLVAGVRELQGLIAARQAVDDILIEVLIDEKLDHWSSPFARARASNSSLLTRPVIPAASNFRRTASASSS